MRFVQTFRPWIEEHTSGVVIVQIRCWEKISSIDPSDEKGIVDNLLTPAGALGNLTILQDFDHDSYLSLLDDLLTGDRLELVRFTYRPVRKQREASLSFHLSTREKLTFGRHLTCQKTRRRCGSWSRRCGEEVQPGYHQGALFSGSVGLKRERATPNQGWPALFLKPKCFALQIPQKVLNLLPKALWVGFANGFAGRLRRRRGRRLFCLRVCKYWPA